MYTKADLLSRQNPLAEHYQSFGVSHRVLLSGHSHQAWPDVALDGQTKAFDLAAAHVDDKWEKVFAVTEEVKSGYADLLDDTTGSYTIAQNTHELLVRFLSALDLQKRHKIITTDGEFYTVKRQFARLAEEAIDLVVVPVAPIASLPERLANQVDDKTAAVLVSAVFFESAIQCPGLEFMLEACQRHGAEFIIDVYHALNVVPFSLKKRDLEEAIVIGGGYKYCQLGEGNAFLRFPHNRHYRPVITGWYSEFGLLTEQHDAAKVCYGTNGAEFAGATYEPTSHFRAAEVFNFFTHMKLTPHLLREVNQAQLRLMCELFDTYAFDSGVIMRAKDIPIESLGGFLSLSSPYAKILCQRLKAKNVYTDCRGNLLRLGPAPYVGLAQIEYAFASLSHVIKELSE